MIITDKFADSYRKLINCYTRKRGNVVVYNDKGQLTNWNELNPLTKEDLIEDRCDNLDYAKNKARFPGLNLLKKIGWKKLIELNEASK